MKKLVCSAMVLLVVCISLCGCGSSSSYVYDDKHEEQASTEPKVVELTVSNIEEYLIFNADVTQSEKNHGIGDGNSVCFADITIKTASKQNVDFENLTVKVSLRSDSPGWSEIKNGRTATEFNETLQIPYNGVWEEEFRIKSEYTSSVYSNPDIEVVVTSVSGQAKLN